MMSLGPTEEEEGNDADGSMSPTVEASAVELLFCCTVLLRGLLVPRVDMVWREWGEDVGCMGVVSIARGRGGGRDRHQDD